MVEKPVAGRLRPFEREWFLHVAWVFRSLVAPPLHPHIMCVFYHYSVHQP
jgi:hypothetical protein